MRDSTVQYSLNFSNIFQCMFPLAILQDLCPVDSELYVLVSYEYDKYSWIVE